MWKADLHNHLGTSGSNPGFDETIDFVSEKLGEKIIFGIANSNDYRFERFVEQTHRKYSKIFLKDLRGVYIPEKEIIALKCQEIFSDQGHILAIGLPYNKNITSKNAQEVIKESKDLGALLCAVHPFYYQGIGNFLKSNPELLLNFSSIETYNGSAEFSFLKKLPKHANYQAQAFFQLTDYNHDLNLGMSSFTDGHSVKSIGTCYTHLDLSFENNEDFIAHLDNSLRQVKSFEHLKMQPNIKDAINHAFKMGLVKLRLRKD